MTPHSSFIQSRSLKLLALTALPFCLLPFASNADDDKPPKSTIKPPSKGLQEVPFQNVKLKGEFWGPRQETHHQTTIPHVLDKLEEQNHLTNFDKAARVLKSGKSLQDSSGDDAAGEALQGNTGSEKSSTPKKTEGIVGHSAFDSDVHKALEGACYTLENFNDPGLKKRVDQMLDRILAAQDKDGYLVSYFIAKEPENKWANLRLNHEMYNAGHFFEFAVAHHQLTGDPKALKAANRFADHIDQVFGPGKRYDVDGHQGVEIALIKLYRATGEKRYLDLCRFLLEERGHLHGSERKPFTDVPPRAIPTRKEGEPMRDYRRRKWSTRNGRMQDHKPILEQTEAVGHAVRAGYMYSAMADIARFSDAPKYEEVLRSLWEDVVFRKIYLTGGVGTAQYGDEGFGDPYLLPNQTYCETCSCIAQIFWQHRMNLLEGDAKYIDVMELVLYNAALSGISLTGDSFFYQNPLLSKNGADRTPWIGLACCPTNQARFIPQIGGLMYATKANSLYVNLYAAGEANIALENGNLKLTQTTEYPHDGKIRLEVHNEEAVKANLLLRIPSWLGKTPLPGDLYHYASPESSLFTLKLNGQPVDATTGEDGYLSLQRDWKAGDVLELNLPMTARRVFSNEKITANKNLVALMRGPLVYCFEGLDNEDTDLFQATLPRDSQLSSIVQPKLLGGVNVIEAQGLDQNGKPTTLRAIPYHTWANRDRTPMNLWIREKAR